MFVHHNKIFIDSVTAKGALDKRLEDIGWGLFLLMIGTLLLLPSELIPPGTWLIGAGLIMLALNAIRYVNHISISRFTVVLAVGAMLVGLASFFGLKLPLLAMFLVVIGAIIVLKSLFPRS